MIYGSGSTDRPFISDQSRKLVSYLYPGIRPLAYRVLGDVYKITGRNLNIVQGMRTFEEQEALYMKGRSVINGKVVITNSAEIVTNARPGMGFHNYGLAFDTAWAGTDPYLKLLNPDERDALWVTYGKCVRGNGMRWGGDFRLANGAHDLPHAEMAYGLTITECLELHDRGGRDAVWAQIDQIRGVSIGEGWRVGP